MVDFAEATYEHQMPPALLSLRMTDSIFVAISHNEESAKKLIGDELIAVLGDLSYTIDYTIYEQSNAGARAAFEAAKEILNLKQSIAVQWK